MKNEMDWSTFWPANQIPHKCLNKECGIGVLWERILWSCLSLHWELVWTRRLPSATLKLLDISGTYRSLLKLSASGTVNTDSCPVSLRTWLPESSLSHHQHEGTHFSPLPPPPQKNQNVRFCSPHLVAPCGWEFNRGRGRGWESRPLARFVLRLF